MENTTFGALLREKRLSANVTLREFARLISYDPSNISKIERGIAIPPSTIMLKAWAKHLGLKPGMDSYQEFLDAGSIARNRLPEDLPANFRNKVLPVVLRTARSKELTKDEFERLIKLLNQ